MTKATKANAGDKATKIRKSISPMSAKVLPSKESGKGITKDPLTKATKK